MDFYRYIARAFGIKDPFETKEQFLEVFETFLLLNEEQKKKVLLIIDEAQRLTSELLEEIRLLSNIEKDYTKLLNIFFVGQNEVIDIIKDERNKALRQRLTVHYTIAPLTEPETHQYIQYRLRVAGSETEIFDAEAVHEVFSFSKGYPRLINIICDRSLLTGYISETAKITGPMVKQCADDLKILVE
jgi:general secretion pathway protein A